MSGHSKWANIKNRKGAQDKKRSEVFTKISKNILTAIRMGGGSTRAEVNSFLRVAIEKAKEANMPKDTIEKLIERFELRKMNMNDYLFEGFGPFGVPIMVEVGTDNKNRVLGEIRLIFKNFGGSLGEEGSVGFMFDRLGEIETKNLTEDLELELIDNGALDFEENTVLTDVADLKKINIKIEEMGLEIVKTGIIYKSKAPVELKSEKELDKMMEMIELLEENDDVVNVFAGFDYHE